MNAGIGQYAPAGYERNHLRRSATTAGSSIPPLRARAALVRDFRRPAWHRCRRQLDGEEHGRDSERLRRPFFARWRAEHRKDARSYNKTVTAAAREPVMGGRQDGVLSVAYLVREPAAAVRSRSVRWRTAVLYVGRGNIVLAVASLALPPDPVAVPRVDDLHIGRSPRGVEARIIRAGYCAHFVKAAAGGPGPNHGGCRGPRESEDCRGAPPSP